VFWLEAMVDANQTLAFTVTVPVIERFVSFLVCWFVGGCFLLPLFVSLTLAKQ
jgi:hypothetical protein